MKLLIVLQLEEGEIKPKMLKLKDIKKFKKAHPTLKFVSEVVIHPDESIDISKDGYPVIDIEELDLNFSRDNNFD